ncbi:MAG TPA: MlaD family protein [Chitinophagaceae bacterium]|jgi:phospholipid/cholesterol/gamma-HCH transport system substrate-binding protein|nr:MlaD family protein [Chitinophagaceae bacterium]
MKTVQNKRTVIVGMFIFFGLLILIITVLTMGGRKNAFEKTITLNATFNDVSGLQKGNNIWFAGIKVGTVKKVELTDHGKIDVEMNIKKQSIDFIHRDAMVKIGSDGLIGNRIVIIYGGTASAFAVKAGDTLRSEMPLNSAQMMNTLQESNQNLSAITSNLKSVSTKLAQGEGTLGQLFTEDSLANSLKLTANTLRYASESVQLLTSNLATYTTKMQQKGVLANDFVSDTIFFNRLKAASLQIQEASQNAKELTDNLSQVSYRMRDSSNLAGVVLQDQESAAKLRASVENLQAGTKKFDENMEALKHNFLFRGYFRKKEKREQAEAQRSQTTAQKRN